MELIMCAVYELQNEFKVCEMSNDRTNALQVLVSGVGPAVLAMLACVKVMAILARALSVHNLLIPTGAHLGLYGGCMASAQSTCTLHKLTLIHKRPRTNFEQFEQLPTDSCGRSLICTDVHGLSRALVDAGLPPHAPRGFKWMLQL